jgi:hypothetical protein
LPERISIKAAKEDLLLNFGIETSIENIMKIELKISGL